MKLGDGELARLMNAGKIAVAFTTTARTIGEVANDGHPFRDGVAPLPLAQRWYDHGVVCWHNAQFAEADDALGRAYGLLRRVHGADHPDTFDVLERLAAVAHYRQNHELAMTRFRAVIDGRERAFPDDEVAVAIARRNYAAVLRDQFKLEARGEIERALAVLERRLPPEHPEVVHALKVDALLHLYERSPQAADRVATRAVELGRRVWSDDHPFVVSAELIVARAELELPGTAKRALKRMPKIIERLEAAYGEHPMVAHALDHYARCDLRLGDHFDRAERNARRGFEMVRRFPPYTGMHHARTIFDALVEAVRYHEAAELAIEIDADATPRLRQLMAATLANAFMRSGEPPTALPWLIRARDGSTTDDVRAQWAAQVARIEQFES